EPDGVRLWRLDDPNSSAIVLPHVDEACAIAFSPDGKWLATGTVASLVTLWDMDAKKPHYLNGHFAKVAAVAWTPNSRRLATGSDDKTIRIWDIATEMEVLTLTEHRGGVTSLQFDSQGDILASASWDGTVKFWIGEETSRAR